MNTRPLSITISAIVAVIFGLLTIASGGLTLFGGTDPGAAVPFVLWFNFLAGFAYVLAGAGLWRGDGWAPGLAVAIVLATAAVFAAFLWHAAMGRDWMGRTMGAMILRTLVWAVIAVLALRNRKKG